jgi:PPOX class probable F420-dependent enzyme
MDRSLAWRRVADSRVARLGTVKPEGPPHLVPCCFDLVGDMVYSAIDAKPKSTSALRRIQNIRANPSACLLVDHYEEDWSALWWVRLDGVGRVVDAPEEEGAARQALVAKYAQYRRLALPGPVIALDIEHWASWP